jgi:hypothetical protein
VTSRELFVYTAWRESGQRPISVVTLENGMHIPACAGFTVDMVCAMENTEDSHMDKSESIRNGNNAGGRRRRRKQIRSLAGRNNSNSFYSRIALFVS